MLARMARDVAVLTAETCAVAAAGPSNFVRRRVKPRPSRGVAGVVHSHARRDVRKFASRRNVRSCSGIRRSLICPSGCPTGGSRSRPAAGAQGRRGGDRAGWSAAAPSGRPGRAVREAAAAAGAATPCRSCWRAVAGAALRRAGEPGGGPLRCAARGRRPGEQGRGRCHIGAQPYRPALAPQCRRLVRSDMTALRVALGASPDTVRVLVQLVRLIESVRDLRLAQQRLRRRQRRNALPPRCVRRRSSRQGERRRQQPCPHGRRRRLSGLRPLQQARAATRDLPTAADGADGAATPPHLARPLLTDSLTKCDGRGRTTATTSALNGSNDCKHRQSQEPMDQYGRGWTRGRRKYLRAVSRLLSLSRAAG